MTAIPGSAIRHGVQWRRRDEPAEDRPAGMGPNAGMPLFDAPTASAATASSSHSSAVKAGTGLGQAPDAAARAASAARSTHFGTSPYRCGGTSRPPALSSMSWASRRSRVASCFAERIQCTTRRR